MRQEAEKISVEYPHLGNDFAVQMLEEAKKNAERECGFEIGKATDTQIRNNRPKIRNAFFEKGFEAHYDEERKRLIVQVEEGDPTEPLTAYHAQNQYSEEDGGEKANDEIYDGVENSDREKPIEVDPEDREDAGNKVWTTTEEWQKFHREKPSQRRR